MIDPIEFERLVAVLRDADARYEAAKEAVKAAHDGLPRAKEAAEAARDQLWTYVDRAAGGLMDLA